MSYSAKFGPNSITNEAPFSIDELAFKKAALIFRAINNKLRMRMLQEIYKNGSLTVSEIYNKLDQEQSMASQHLAILRKADLVKTKRNGKFIHYTVNLDRIREIHEKALQLNSFKD